MNLNSRANDVCVFHGVCRLSIELSTEMYLREGRTEPCLEFFEACELSDSEADFSNRGIKLEEQAYSREPDMSAATSIGIKGEANECDSKLEFRCRRRRELQASRDPGSVSPELTRRYKVLLVSNSKLLTTTSTAANNLSKLTRS